MNVRDMATCFEAVMLAFSKAKDGFTLKLSIHPNDVPPALLSDPIGARYQVALVRIGDDEQPMAPQEMVEIDECIRSAGMLCKEKSFQDFLTIDLNVWCPETEEGAANVLRQHLGIKSRSEMEKNKEARDKFKSLVSRYKKALSK